MACLRCIEREHDDLEEQMDQQEFVLDSMEEHHRELTTQLQNTEDVVEREQLERQLQHVQSSWADVRAIVEDIVHRLAWIDNNFGDQLQA